MKRKPIKNNMKNNVIERKGFNVYGEPCIERIVKLEKETAIQQYIEIIKVLKKTKKIIEYTLDFSNFSKEEAEQFGKIAERIAMMYGI